MSSGTLSDELAVILARLDRRPRAAPARVELSREDEGWLAQIVADPLYKPIVGRGPFVAFALAQLLEQDIDWRKVKR